MSGAMLKKFPSNKKMLFKLTAINEEYLPTVEIDAETIEEAKAQFIEQWESGNFIIGDSGLRIFEMRDGLVDKEI